MNNLAFDYRCAQTALSAVLTGFGRDIAVAVSGGIDSLTLATVAHRLRPQHTTMLHAVSPAVPGEATERVRRLGREEGWHVDIFDAGEFADPNYRANPVNRCFYCKTNLYAAIAARSDGAIVSGANTDDLGEYRPGLDAAREHGVRHPYLEAGISKAGVRALARGLGLGDLAELPAAPCLSSRVETGIAIRGEELAAIHTAEQTIRAAVPMATVRCRVRASGIVIELDAASLAGMPEATKNRIRLDVEQIFAGLGSARAITFAPYRNGSAFLRARA